MIAENFAVPTGSTLDINLGSAGPVSLSATGGNITASQNGVQITFSGFTGRHGHRYRFRRCFEFQGPLALPFTFVNCGSSTVKSTAAPSRSPPTWAAQSTSAICRWPHGASAMITPATTNSPTTLALGTLSIAATGVLDVANNEVLINYGSGPDPISTIAGWIASGHAAGAWNGSGIISSVAQTNPSYGLGYADSADTGNPAGFPPAKSKSIHIARRRQPRRQSERHRLRPDGGQFQPGRHRLGQRRFQLRRRGERHDFVLMADNFNQSAQIAAVRRR